MTNERSIINENVLKSKIREKIEEATERVNKNVDKLWGWMATINERMRLLEDKIDAQKTQETGRKK